MRYVLDSDILTALLKKEPTAAKHLQGKLEDNHTIILSAVTYYEIKRGLKAKKADKQLDFFLQLCALFNQVDITKPIIEIAVDNWVDRRTKGMGHNDDADIILTATALCEKAILVTRNTKDFLNQNLTLESWN